MNKKLEILGKIFLEGNKRLGESIYCKTDIVSYWCGERVELRYSNIVDYSEAYSIFVEYIWEKKLLFGTEVNIKLDKKV